MKTLIVLKSIANIKIPRILISLTIWTIWIFIILFSFLLGLGFGINNAKKEDYDPSAPIFRVYNSTYFVRMDCSAYTVKGRVVANHCAANTSNIANAKVFCSEQVGESGD